ncbi:MAG: BamA/TamA family outer membrane protein [Akkermansiaceae bacterium]|nr:BamA/TamA family outer membrane protein [Akkermansiaceae bacterium]
MADTQIRIRGVPGMRENQVLSLLGGRLSQIRSKPATPSRADDAAFLLRQMLQQDGCANAEVAWNINGSGEIILTATNAARLSMGEVTITGADPKQSKRLARLFVSPAEKDQPPGPGSAPFRESDVATGLSYLQQDYHANGYWVASATVEKREQDPTTGAISFTIDITPGPQHLIARPTVASSDPAITGPVATTTAPFVGQPATTGSLNAMRNAVEKAFLSAGFPDARVAMASKLDPPRFIPQFDVTRGKRVHLRHLNATGFVKTDPERIERRLRSLEGEWYDTTTLNKRIREFLATGAFSSVRVETTPAGADSVDATLHFEEGKAREFTFAAGGGSYDGPIFRILYGDRNFRGRMLGLSTGFEFTSRGVLGDVRLTNPWLFGSDYAGTARLYSIIYGHEGYTSFDTGLQGILSRKYGEHFRGELSLGYSIVNNNEDGLPSFALGDNAYNHTRLRFTPVWDYRDNPVIATSGWLLRTPVQIGTVMGDDSAGYLSVGLNGGWFRPLGADYQLAVLGQFGMLAPTGDAIDFPIDLRYFNGGANTVRSFPERELGPSINGYATGGNAYWAANLEIIRPLAGPVKLVGFLDAGALSLDYADILSADLELAVGLGIRLDLPIGPVRLEYGYSLTRDPGEPAGAFHFAIGTTF